MPTTTSTTPPAGCCAAEVAEGRRSLEFILTSVDFLRRQRDAVPRDDVLVKDCLASLYDTAVRTAAVANTTQKELEAGAAGGSKALVDKKLTQMKLLDKVADSLMRNVELCRGAPILSNGDVEVIVDVLPEEDVDVELGYKRLPVAPPIDVAPPLPSARLPFGFASLTRAGVRMVGGIVADRMGVAAPAQQPAPLTGDLVRVATVTADADGVARYTLRLGANPTPGCYPLRFTGRESGIMVPLAFCVASASTGAGGSLPVTGIAAMGWWLATSGGLVVIGMAIVTGRRRFAGERP